MNPPDARDLSFEHLQAELARLHILISREVRRWQLAGQDAQDALRGLYVSDEQAAALLERPFAVSWGQTVALDPAEAGHFHGALAQAEQRVHLLAEQAHAAGVPLRLEQLALAFGLDRLALDALLLCVLAELDLRYESLYGYLQDDVTRRRPSVSLVLDLLCEAGPARLLALARFADEAPLFRHRLLQWAADPGQAAGGRLRQPLRVDETVLAWLLGRYEPGPELAARAALQWPDGAGGLPVAGVLNQLALDSEPVLVFQGPDRASQAAAAGQLAARLGRALLAVDLAAVIAADTPPAAAVRLSLRDARLTGALPYLDGWDACLEEGVLPPRLLAEVCEHPGIAILAGRTPWQPGGVARQRELFRVDFPLPSYAERRALWQHYLTETAGDQVPDVTAPAGRFLLAAGQIRDAVATAWDLAAQRGGPLSTEDLLAAARAHSNAGLGALARKIVPRYAWEDIVLPPDQQALLREIIAAIRERPLVLDQWGVGHKLAAGAGVTMLFAGPPGTGKTMAAEIIASELALDLYKIDLSAIVSKYIGETEKNLERIFAAAEASNAILFFDEADALFGKRSEVRDSHDRYANIEISYLLQRMEAYEGVTVLATNLRANLDEAFTRRLQFVVDFPFPEEEDRLRIWQALFPPDVPRAPELDYSLLARRYKLAGGNIRNVIVGAAYLAAADGRSVTMDHVLHATRRELQKMGRLLPDENTGI